MASDGEYLTQQVAIWLIKRRVRTNVLEFSEVLFNLMTGPETTPINVS
jgi:hypothetical protein